jgi:hypothetical protein
VLATGGLGHHSGRYVPVVQVTFGDHRIVEEHFAGLDSSTAMPVIVTPSPSRALMTDLPR